jgi:non-ribosomal peptide synthetase component F
LHSRSIAIRTADETISYEALNRAANRIAHAILARRGAGDEPIAFVVDRPAIELICLLGILKAGKTYVALDPGHPSSRLQAVCADVEPGLILTTGHCEPLADRLAIAPRECLNIEEPDAGLPDHNPSSPSPHHVWRRSSLPPAPLVRPKASATTSASCCIVSSPPSSAAAHGPATARRCFYGATRIGRPRSSFRHCWSGRRCIRST